MLDTALFEARRIGVRSVAREGTARLFDILTLAFATDPAVRRLFPDPQQYLEYFPRFARAFGGGAIAEGTAFVSGERAAVALWLPPGCGPDDAALGSLLEESVAAADKATVFAVFDAMAHYHPVEPHWYLPLIGVDPAFQGLGHGSELMAAALRLCDASHLPAYLEATSRRSIPLYQAHGFETVGEIAVRGFPPIVPMWRPAL